MRSAGVLGGCAAMLACCLAVPAGAHEAWGEHDDTPKSAVSHDAGKGARVRAVKGGSRDAARVYAATDRGLLASRDGGKSWKKASPPGQEREVFSLAVDRDDASRVCMGSRDGLWRSSDGGATWQALGAPVAGAYVPTALALAGRAGEVVYAGTARHGLFRSDDGGRTWRGRGKGLPEPDGAAAPAEIHAIAVDPDRPDTAFAAYDRDRVFRTTDGGDTWHRHSEGLPAAAARPGYPPRLAVDPDEPGRLYMVLAQPVHSKLVRNQLYTLAPEGRWVAMEAELPANAAVVGLAVDSKRRVLRVWGDDAVWEVGLPAAATGGRR